MASNPEHRRVNSHETLVAETPTTFFHTPPMSPLPKESEADFGNQRQQPSAAQEPDSPTSSNTDYERDIEKEADQQSNHGKKPAQEEQQKDPNVVEWDGPDDPENPQNFKTWRKWIITITMSMLTLTITFASSIFSSALEVVAAEYHIGQVTATLGVSLVVAGFCVGPMVWGPMSELYGRTPPLFIGFIIFLIFQVPVAVAQNVQTIMISRFFQGVFGSAPLAVVGGALADIWDPVDRGVAISMFSSATFIGPVAGPIVGGFVTQSHLGWRWTAWLTLFLGAAAVAVALFVIPETYSPVLLQRRAKKRRIATKNWALHARMEESETSLGDIATRYLLRPPRMLVQEPILLLITLYMALIYGILYLFFESYPISFQRERGWNLGVGALPFLGITVGVLIGAVIVSWITKTRYKRKLEENHGMVPEERLPPMIIGAFMLPIGLFWFAWTSNPHITWVPQVISGIPIGMGVFMIFMQSLNYIIDCYLMNANSAIAGNTFIRSAAGAGFPLFATPMFEKLGVPWANSLLGFLTVAFIPVPILFYIYGKKLRSLSKFVPTL